MSKSSSVSSLSLSFSLFVKVSGKYLKVKVKVAQSCPTLCDPMDNTVHGLLQARMYWSG